MKADLSLRDSWLYTGQVLAWWLTAQVERIRPLDGTLKEIRADARLRTLLLPGRPGSTNAPAGVRVDLMTHARSVAALVRAAFATPPLLDAAGISELVEDLIRSDFDDPRLVPLSEGWRRVRMFVEEPFRRFLSSLSEQDLEVFFSHAMNEPDRRNFWMRYLRSIERTGCVLDKKSQESLMAKLHGSSRLQGAIERAYKFKHASSVQAFFLVFPRIVVVEFSDRGNAVYVSDREYFEQKLERRIRTGRCDGVGELKLLFHNLSRFMHHRNWQEKVEQWLSEQGIHAQPGRRW